MIICMLFTNSSPSKKKKDELLELYIHAFNIFTKRNEITIKLEDRITLNEIFKKYQKVRGGNEMIDLRKVKGALEFIERYSCMNEM